MGASGRCCPWLSAVSVDIGFPGPSGILVLTIACFLMTRALGYWGCPHPQCSARPWAIRALSQLLVVVREMGLSKQSGLMNVDSIISSVPSVLSECVLHLGDTFCFLLSEFCGLLSTWCCLHPSGCCTSAGYFPAASLAFTLNTSLSCCLWIICFLL